MKGDGYGKKIGFPTVNLDRRSFSRMNIKPAFGVYSGIAVLNNKKYKSGIVIGPIDEAGLPKIEAHMIGFNGNIYGKKIILRIEKFIRKFKRFKTERELILQIKNDLKKVNS